MQVYTYGFLQHLLKCYIAIVHYSPVIVGNPGLWSRPKADSTWLNIDAEWGEVLDIPSLMYFTYLSNFT
jgi:hypothetical protein